MKSKKKLVIGMICGLLLIAVLGVALVTKNNTYNNKMDTEELKASVVTTKRNTNYLEVALVGKKSKKVYAKKRLTGDGTKDTIQLNNRVTEGFDIKITTGKKVDVLTWVWNSKKTNSWIPFNTLEIEGLNGSSMVGKSVYKNINSKVVSLGGYGYRSAYVYARKGNWSSTIYIKVITQNW